MKNIYLYISIVISCGLFSCKKYLDEKPNIKLAVPTSLSDYQKIMDDGSFYTSNTPQIGDLGCDDYYLTYPSYQAYGLTPRNCYIWASDIWQGQGSAFDWSDLYNKIYRANVVLEGLKDFPVKDAAEQITKDGINGHALFVRAHMHYFLEETFGQPYKPASANTDLGIPLKLTANLAVKAVRSTTKVVYDQIINDLLQAKDLVPAITPNSGRPSKAAVFALLSRVYLTMQDYSKAGVYADSCLKYKNELLNYNDITPANQLNTSTNPFAQYALPNEVKEIIYFSIPESYAVIRSSVLTTYIDTTLFNSYASNDIRKTVFFRYTAATNTYNYKGSYTSSTISIFSGLAVDEVYLIRAESYARAGNKDSALAVLNRLLVNRYKTGTFVNVGAIDADDALAKIIAERRKELVFRSLRWIDLRRLNQDSRFAKTLTRNLNGQVYTLPPNDPKYAYPIPDVEIQLSGIPQNPR